MNKKVFGNVVMNFVIVIVFVILNNWALRNNFEETFISLAVIYGIAVVISNAFFVSKFCKK